MCVPTISFKLLFTLYIHNMYSACVSVCGVRVVVSVCVGTYLIAYVSASDKGVTIKIIPRHTH